MPVGIITQNKTLSGGITTGDHETLRNRDAADQHPISAITGLQDALNTKDSKILDLDKKINYESNRAIQNESKLLTSLGDTKTALEKLISSTVLQETERAKTVENKLYGKIADTTKELSEADQKIILKLNAEIQRAMAEEKRLIDIATDAQEAAKKIDEIVLPIKKDLKEETANRLATENELSNLIASTSYQLHKEILDLKDYTDAEIIKLDAKIKDEIFPELKKLADDIEASKKYTDEEIKKLNKKIADEIDPKLAAIEKEIKDLEESIGKNIKEKVEQLQKDLAAEATARKAADDALDKKIDDTYETVGEQVIEIAKRAEEEHKKIREELGELAEYVEEHVKDLRIEDITKTTKLDTRAESGYYIADKFIAGANYYEKVELARSRIAQENIDLQSEYVPVEVNEKNFVKNKYYVYRASTSKSHAPVYRIARFFDPNKKYYQYSYGTNDTISFGMWLMPKTFNFAVQNLPNVINNVGTAVWVNYGSALNAATLKYYWYDSRGLLQRPPVSRICVEDNSTMSFKPNLKYKFSRIMYGNWTGIIGSGQIVYWAGHGWDDESARLIYVEDTTSDPWYDNPVHAALGLKYDFRAEKVSDILLPYGDNSYHKEWRRVYPTAADFKNENNIYYENIYECVSELVEVSESEIPVGAARYKAVTGVSQDVLIGTWRFPEKLSKPIPSNLSWSGNYVCRFRDHAGGGVFGNGLKIFAGVKHTDGSQWFNMNFNSEYWREGNIWLMAENKVDAETGELYGQCCRYLSFEAEDEAMYNIVTTVFEGERISDKILGKDFFEWEVLEQELANKYPVYEQVLPANTRALRSADEKYFITKVPEGAINDYVVTRMSVTEDVSIIRGSTGADVFVVTDDNAYVNGTAIQPVINTYDTQKPEIMIVDNGELVYTAPLISLLVGIPANTNAGFCSSIMFEVQDGLNFNFNYINNTKLPVRFIKFGQVVEKQYLDFAPGNQYTMLVMCNGRIVEIYIQEVLL